MLTEGLGMRLILIVHVGSAQSLQKNLLIPTRRKLTQTYPNYKEGIICSVTRLQLITRVP